MREPTPRPEYRPASLRAFEIAIGESDATVEWIEVSIRHLEHEHSHGGDEGIARIASDARVRVNPIPLGLVRTRAAGLAILSVFQHFEHFLRAFRREHPRQVPDRDDDDFLTYTLGAFGATKEFVGEFEVDVAEYYRLVRNHLMHAVGAEQKKRDITLARRLRCCVPTSYDMLKAPNDLEEIGFDDFVLFTRVVKSIARRLCDAASPTAAELRKLVLRDESFIRALKGESVNAKRIEQKLAKYIQVRLGFPTTAYALAAEVLTMGPLAQG